MVLRKLCCGASPTCCRGCGGGGGGDGGDGRRRRVISGDRKRSAVEETNTAGTIQNSRIIYIIYPYRASSVDERYTESPERGEGGGKQKEVAPARSSYIASSSSSIRLTDRLTDKLTD